MSRLTFYTWLQREVDTSRMALLGLYEKRDHILYVEAPPLRKKYMDVIGCVEEEVLQAELEVSLLQQKVDIIQACVNRRETVDMEAIDQQIEVEREKKISDLEHADLTLEELPQLSEQEEHTIQREYREITNMFHPAMNKDITDTQKELYEKAVEAYKLQNVESMKLIYDLLFSPEDTANIDFEIEFGRSDSTITRADYQKTAMQLSADYLLAKKLYSCFKPLEEDAVVQDTIQTYEEERKKVEEEIEQIRAGFPFNAVETMNDSKKTEEYLAELRVRKKRCDEQKEELEQKIAQMTKEQSNG